MMVRSCLLIIVLMFSFGIFASDNQISDEEFTGPFSSWRNLKTYYGAVGDDSTDDYIPIQKALDDLRLGRASNHWVLYIPAGTFRITKRISLFRDGVPNTQGTQGTSIIGEDPATTTIRWDGTDSIMFYYEPWFAKLSRITFDGSSKVKTILYHGKSFATYMEYSDLVFKNAAFGMEVGERDGIAEAAVWRCTFINCTKAGINIQNFNTLDWWIWYNHFVDCHIGVSNEYNGGGGHFHVFNSLFERSTEADITIKHTSYFGIRYNTSINSKAFFVAKRADNWKDSETWGAEAAFHGNTIIDPIDNAPIRIANSGATILLDNTFCSRPNATTGPVIVQNSPTGNDDMVAIGNKFTVAHAIDLKNGRLTSLDNKVVATATIASALPALPATPPNNHRLVIEVPPGATAMQFQNAINAAAKLMGQRPIVHIPAGEYSIDQTLVIPAGCDMQLVGDGAHPTTILGWSGKSGKAVLLLKGPSHAVLSNFSVNAGKSAEGIVIENCDQKGAFVFIDALNVNNSTTGILVDRLDNCNTSLYNTNHAECQVGFRAVGGALTALNKPRPGRTVFFSGSSSNNGISYELDNNAKLLVRDIWYESGTPRFVNLTGSGSFTLHGAVVAAGASDSTNPIIRIADFKGNICFLGVELSWTKKQKVVQIINKAGSSRSLFLGGALTSNEGIQMESPKSSITFLNFKTMTSNGREQMADIGKADSTYITSMLADTRLQKPMLSQPPQKGITNVQMHRISSSNATVAIHCLAGKL